MHSLYIEWETSFKDRWRVICKQTLSAPQVCLFQVRWVAVNQWSLDFLVLFSLVENYTAMWRPLGPIRPTTGQWTQDSVLQILSFCTLIQTPEGDWCKAMKFKTRKEMVESLDSVYKARECCCSVLWMGSPGWKHCFSPCVFVLWKWDWKLWGVLMSLKKFKRM